MLFKTDITNCRIIVYTEDKKQLADASIKKYDAQRDIGTIDGDYLKDVASQKVNALVFTKSGLLECNGTLRDGFGQEKEICFFKTNEKNDRAATRYDVNMMGNVVAVLKKSTGEIIKDALPCKVINMSATGILFSCPSQRMEVGDVPSITCYKDGHKMQIVSNIVRVHSSSVQEESFGCRIVKLVSN